MKGLQIEIDFGVCLYNNGHGLREKLSFWTHEGLLNNFSVLLQSILSGSNLPPIFNLISVFCTYFRFGKEH